MKCLPGLLLAALCLFGLSGCWDRIETDDLALIMGSGLDLTEDGQLEATFQIALPTAIPGALSGVAKQGKPVITISAVGKDGLDIVGQIQQELSRTVFLGHRVIVVIGEKFARHGIDRVLDSFLRLPGSRYNSYIVTSYGATAKEILNSPYALEHIPAFGMNKILSGDAGYGVKIGEFLDAFSAPDRTPVTAAVRLVGDGSAGATFIMDRLAVYRENRLSGFLSQKQLKLFLMAKGRVKQSKYTMQLIPPDKMYNGTVCIDLSESKLQILTRLENGKPAASLTLSMEAKIWENNTNLDFSQIDLLRMAERRFSEELRDGLQEMIGYSQQTLDADILGIGKKLHNQHPYAWKKLKADWPILYRQMTVDTKVRLQIERTGRTQAPAQLNQNLIRK